VFGFSAVTGEGRAELWSAIRRACDVGQAPRQEVEPSEAPNAKPTQE